MSEAEPLRQPLWLPLVGEELADRSATQALPLTRDSSSGRVPPWGVGTPPAMPRVRDSGSGVPVPKTPG